MTARTMIMAMTLGAIMGLGLTGVMVAKETHFVPLHSEVAVGMQVLTEDGMCQAYVMKGEPVFRCFKWR